MIEDGHPRIAFITVANGGPGGTALRDTRLAAALRRRGFNVTIYWMFGTQRAALSAGIPSRWLASGAQFLVRRGLPVTDFLLRHLDWRSERQRYRAEQRHARLQQRALANILETFTAPVPLDPGLVRRLERFMRRDRVTHVVNGMALFGGLTEAVAARGRHQSFTTLLTLQGDELTLAYARSDAVRAAAIACLRRRLLAASPRPIAVSKTYAGEIERLLGLPPDFLGAVYPGIETGRTVDRDEAPRIVSAFLPGFDPARPAVTFLGRIDSEKGVDLLLYALRLLRERGIAPQIVIAGGASFGADYERACHHIARQMELPAIFTGPLGEADRDALFAVSRCVVYPSIHVESFGLVAAEAMAQGTPIVVPRRGGLAEAVSDGTRDGGLTFQPWDSGDLARQIERLLTDDALHASLAANARTLAQRFDVEVAADGLLAALGLPAQPAARR